MREDWQELYARSKKPDGCNYDQITDQIFLGGYAAAEELTILKDIMKVDVVLTVATSLPPMFPEHFEYKIVEIVDDS